MSLWSKIEKRVADVADELLPSEERLRVTEARKLLDNDNAPKALSLLKSIKGHASESLEAQLLLSKCYIKTGATTTALDLLYKLSNKEAGHPEIFASIAEAQFKLLNFDAALEASQRAIATDKRPFSNTLESRTIRGKMFILQNRPLASLKEFRQAASLSNENLRLKSYCSAAKVLSGTYNQNDFTELFSVEDDFFLALAKAKSYLDKVELDDCIKESERAHALNSFQSCWPLVFKARAYSQLKDHCTALSTIESAVLPKNALSELNLDIARIAYSAKDYKRSSLMSLKAMGIFDNPSDFENAFFSFIQNNEPLNSYERLLTFASVYCDPSTIALWEASLHHFGGDSKTSLDKLSQIASKSLSRKNQGWLEYLKAQSTLRQDDATPMEHLKKACVALYDKTEFFDEFTNVSLQKARVISRSYNSTNVFSTLESICAAFRDHKDLANKAALYSSSSRQPLTVAIMGEFSVGKSSLINAILGNDMAPTGVKPTTDELVLYRQDKPPLIGLTDIKHCFLNTTSNSGSESSPIQLIDTPGLNSGDSSHKTKALDVLSFSDLIIWVFSATQAGTKSELEAINEIKRHEKAVYGVLGKSDLVNSQEQVELETFIQSESNNAFEIFWNFSSKDDLLKRTFVDKWNQTVGPQRLKLKSSNNSRNVLSIIKDIRNTPINSQSAVGVSDIKNYELSLKQAVAKHQDSLRARIIDLKSVLKDSFDHDFQLPDSRAEPILTNAKTFDDATYDYIDANLKKLTLTFIDDAFAKERTIVLADPQGNVSESSQPSASKHISKWLDDSYSMLKAYLHGFFTGFASRHIPKDRKVDIHSYKEFLSLFLLQTRSIAETYSRMASDLQRPLFRDALRPLKEDLLMHKIEKIEALKGFDELLDTIEDDHSLH